MQTTITLKPKRHRIPTELMIDTKIYCYLERKNGKKLKDIAWDLRRDHSTVLYHLSDIEFLLQNYRHIKFALETFNKKEFLKKIEENRKKTNKQKWA